MSKTIFHPGKALTSKWLNSSQYLGPSNPGIVFKANPVNDWEYPLLKATALDLVNFNNYFVSATTNQTLGGLKNFTTIPTFPTATATSGLQAVNIDYLNNAGFVRLTTDQTVSGVKTFTDLRNVTTQPLVPDSVVNIAYFDLKGVTINDDQTIFGSKTFNQVPIIPAPTISSHATNKQYVDNAIQAQGLSQSQNCVKVGNIQTIYGTSVITGAWNSQGALDTGDVYYNTVAPSALPFTNIISASSCIDRLVHLATEASLTKIKVIGDSFNSPYPANDGLVRWSVTGYV
jgi:hypothetical protein